MGVECVYVCLTECMTTVCACTGSDGRQVIILGPAWQLLLNYPVTSCPHWFSQYLYPAPAAPGGAKCW
jgi:hypothetical protein